MNELKFYKEKETETIIASIEEPGKEKYIELVPNTNDAAKEKHIPVYEVKGDEMFVRVGEIEHPMEENHYIAFIALINGHDITKVDLKPNDKPEATFKYIKGSEIYAYCNKHDIWKAKVK